MIKEAHPDIVFKNISNGEVNTSTRGMEEFRALAVQSKQLFSSRKQFLKTFEPTDDGATIQVEYTAVLTTDLSNGTKSGVTLQLTGRLSTSSSLQTAYIRRLSSQSRPAAGTRRRPLLHGD